MHPLFFLKLDKRGFSLVEVMITLSISVVLLLGIYSMIQLSLRVTYENQIHLEATELAKQKIEMIHSLSYASVGTVSGTPTGVIPDCETVTKKGIYQVCTKVEFQDDAYDGLMGDATPDVIPNDYKLVLVTVSWQTKSTNKKITLHTKIVPSTQETGDGYGLLRVKVSDTGYLYPDKKPVALAGAKVNISNTTLGINIDKVTDVDGFVNYLTLPGESYKILVSHNTSPTDYGTDMTFGTSTGMTPLHITVGDGQMSYEQFTIDKKGLINVKSALASNLPDVWQINNGNEDRLQKNIQVAKDASDNLYFVWESETSTSTHSYIQKYDSAATPVKQWSSDIRLNNTIFQKNPDISTGQNGYSYVVWQDNSIKLRNTAYQPGVRYVKKENYLQKLKNKLYKTVTLHKNKIKEGWSLITKNTKKKIETIKVEISRLKKKDLVAKAAPGDYFGLKVQKKTASITGKNRTATIYLDTPVDPNHAFLVMQQWWSTGDYGIGQPDEHQVFAYLDPSGMAVIAKRSGEANYTTDEEVRFSFYIVEAKNEEFVVRHRNSLTILYNSNEAREIIYNNFSDPNKITVFTNSGIEMDTLDPRSAFNNRGYTTVDVEYNAGSGDYEIVANRGGTIDADFLSYKVNTIVRYEVIEWLDPKIKVQTGRITDSIGTAEKTFSLSSSPYSPVDTERAWLHSNMLHQDNGLSENSVRIYLKNSNTIGYIRKEGTHNSTMKWWIIEFPRGVKIQRNSGLVSAGDSILTKNQTITAVNLEKSWSDSYRSAEKATFVNGPYTPPTFPIDRWTETLSNSTTLTWRRYDLDNSSTDFSYQVIDTSNWDRPVEVNPLGAQIASIDEDSNDQYIGGAFILSKENFSSNISSITITENGTVDAQNKLKNIKLTYDVDTTAPYTCDDASYPGSLQFGATDSDGFSSSNGTSTFTTLTTVTASSTQSLCFYVTMDIEDDVNKYDNIDIKINNPQNDIILGVDTGYIRQKSPVEIPGKTEILLPPFLEQIHYLWREDDGDEVSATNHPLNTPVVKKPGEEIRLRLSVNNSGSKQLNTSYRLKYGVKDGGNCASISTWYSINAGLDWDTFDSANLNEGVGTTDISPLINPNNIFVAGYIRDQTVDSGPVILEHNNFTELEFSLISKTSIEDKEYCFRVERDSDNSLSVYTVYPEITIIGDYNIFIKKINNSDGSTEWTKQVNSNEDPDLNKFSPRITTFDDGGNDYSIITWYDSNNNLFAQKIDGNGNRLWDSGNDLTISATAMEEKEPDIIVDSQNDILITWVMDGGIKLNKFSSSTGATIWASNLDIDTENNNFAPRITIDAGDNYYISWAKNISSPDVYAAKINTAQEIKWSKRANVSDETYSQSNPNIMIDNTNAIAYVSWIDDRLSNQDIYIQKIDINTSATIWPNDYRVNFDTGGENQQNPVLIMRGTDPIAAWQDNHLALAAKFRPEGPVNLIPFPGAVVTASSTKLSSRTPLVSKASSTFTTNGLGEYSVAIEHDFDGYNFSVGGGHSIVATDPSLPLELAPEAIKNIVIYIN